MSAPSLRRDSRQAGIALLLVVWLLMLLTVLSGEFIVSGRVKVAADRNKRDDLRGFALALAGYRAAVAALDGQITGLSVDGNEQLLLHYQNSEVGVAAAAADQRLGDGTYSWRIYDEDGLLPINEAQPPVLAKLLQQCDLGPGAERDTVIDSILDWRDTNREHHLNGAEEDYYRGLDPPYSCKDGRLDVVEELLLVRGVTPRLFTGGQQDDQVRPGLRDLVTVRQGTFNPATAPRAVLEALVRQRPPGPAPPSLHYGIIATGNPGAGAPVRTLRAVVRREEKGGTRSLTLVYWNDVDTPD